MAITVPEQSPAPLSQNQLEAALLDPVVFVDQHCWIRVKGGRTERFRVNGDWAYQRETLQCFDEEPRVLVLKARQLGISWLADAFGLWLCTANRGQTVIILSQGQRESQEEMRRVRFMHRRLPPELRRRPGLAAGDHQAPDTTVHLEVPDMDSRIISLPSTEHAGTSFTATLVIIHELAKIKTANTLMAAITPTMADEGRLIIVSTAFGFSGTFYEYWRNNQDRWQTGQVVGERGGPGSFRPVFIPWYARPGRDEAWYEATAQTLTAKDMRQEYPASPTEAFQGSADAVFAEEFERGTHGLDQSRHPRSAYEVVHGVDPGVNHGLGYLLEVQGRNAFVFAEVHLENQSVDALGKALATEDRSFGLEPSGVPTYVDPAAAGRNLQTLRTDYDVLREAGLLVHESPERYSPAQRVGLIKLLLKNGRLWISQDCPDLLDALERAQWKRRRGPDGTMIREDTYDKDGVYEHPLDALGYALCRVFPPVAPAAVETEATAIAVYSGSEFG